MEHSPFKIHIRPMHFKDMKWDLLNKWNSLVVYSDIHDKSRTAFKLNKHRFCADAAKQLGSRQKSSIVHLYYI